MLYSTFDFFSRSKRMHQPDWEQLNAVLYLLFFSRSRLMHQPDWEQLMLYSTFSSFPGAITCINRTGGSSMLYSTFDSFQEQTNASTGLGATECINHTSPNLLLPPFLWVPPQGTSLSPPSYGFHRRVPAFTFREEAARSK